MNDDLGGSETSSEETPASRRTRRRRTWLGTGLLIVCSSIIASGAGSSGATTGIRPSSTSASKPGSWIPLGASLQTPESGNPVIWMGKDNRGWVVWTREVSVNNFTYDVAILKPNGGISVQPVSTFQGTGWQSLSGEPTLLTQGSQPILVFDGGRGTTGPYSYGCIYGALPGRSQWVLQPWTLSNNCSNPVGTAGESKNGTLSAAWPGGWPTGHGVQYRIGVSKAIPAPGADSRIPLGSADAYKVGDVSDVAGNGDFYVAWAQEFSAGHGDGYYVKDVTTSAAKVKAPGSDTNSVNTLGVFTNLAITNTNAHKGVFLSYCVGSSPCHLVLWRADAAKALKVPDSADASDVAISAGPNGRVWVAWANENVGDVYVVRTNRADTRFGAVKTYKTPCFEHEILGLSSGNWGRLDIAMQCVNNAQSKLEEYATQSLVGLNLSSSAATVHNNTAHGITFTVADVGDPVAGAKVAVDGKHATTNAAGKATITFAKGTKTGTYRVTVTALNYLSATGNVSIVSSSARVPGAPAAPDDADHCHATVATSTPSDRPLRASSRGSLIRYGALDSARVSQLATISSASAQPAIRAAV